MRLPAFAPPEAEGARIHPDLFDRPLDEIGTMTPPPLAHVPDNVREKMLKLASEMLLEAGEHGLGFDEVRLAAETRGWLTGAERGSALSFGSKLMLVAGGVPVRSRRTKIKASARRRIRVYVHRKFRPVPED
jgi:hypothetical protein